MLSRIIAQGLFLPFLRIVPYAKIDKKNGFFSISNDGVTFWSKTENNFTRLDEWYAEYVKFRQVNMIETFKKFRIAKNFRAWSKTVKRKKFETARKFIGKNLFFANPCLNQAMLEIRDEYCRLVCFKFTDIASLENYQLLFFNENQMTQFKQTRELLDKFRQKTVSLLFDACNDALKAQGFSPEDEILNCKSIKKLKEQISFTTRNNKLHFCSRLTKFLFLADLIHIDLLYNVLRNSIEDLAQIIQLHSDLGPSFEKLSEISDTGVEVEDLRPPELPQSSFLVAELVLKPNNVEVDPSREITLNVFIQMIDLFLEAIRNVSPFQSDAHFKLFTKPSIVGHQEDRLFAVTASIDFMIDSDDNMNTNKQSIIENINLAYDKVECYVETFDPLREAYKEDVQMDKEQLRGEKDLNLLREYCKRYTNEISDLERLLPNCNLGVLRLRQGTFKAEIIPKCRELLLILEEILANLAKTTVSEVRDKTEDLMTELTTIQADAQSLVTLLRFLEECPAKIDATEEVFDYALRAYEIMEEFAITTSEEEKKNLWNTEDFLEQLKSELSTKVESRQATIDLLAKSLLDNVSSTVEEVENVRIEIVKPEFIDVSFACVVLSIFYF